MCAYICDIYFLAILIRIDTNVTLTSMTICLLFDSINELASSFHCVLYSACVWKGPLAVWVINDETFVFYFTLLFDCVVWLCIKNVCVQMCVFCVVYTMRLTKQSETEREHTIYWSELFSLHFFSRISCECENVVHPKWKHQVYTRDTTMSVRIYVHRTVKTK